MNRQGKRKGESVMNAHGIRPAILVSCVLLAMSALCLASGEEINWQVISAGGTDATSTHYGLMGTVGQTAVDAGASTNFVLHHGYWQDFATGGGGLCGDANGDEAINIGDAVYLINYIFKGGPAPDPVCVGDANGDDAVNIGDAVYLINYIFKGGPAPVADCCP
jgi:hypothetical protein